MADGPSQWQRRRPLTLSDQHGRKFETTLDTVAMGPCAPINPKSFTPPFEIPQKYLKFKSEDGQMSLYVNYPQWIEDLEAAHKDYDTRLYNDAIMLFGVAGVQMYTSKAPELVKHTGTPPQPVEFVKAAQQENQWALGFTDAMPSWARALMPKIEAKVSEFPDADEERFLDVEEEEDPDALGGKRINPKKNATRVKEAA